MRSVEVYYKKFRNLDLRAGGSKFGIWGLGMESRFFHTSY